MTDAPRATTKEFHGPRIDTQRIRITVECLSEFYADFVRVFHSHGDDSVTEMLFTDAEARYLREVLEKIYG